MTGYLSGGLWRQKSIEKLKDRQSQLAFDENDISIKYLYLYYCFTGNCDKKKKKKKIIYISKRK